MTDLRADTRGSRFEAMGRMLANPRPILSWIGVYMVRKTMKAFRDQKYGTNAWKPRRVPNVPAALRDLDKSPNVKARRFQARPALVDTGRLRGSFSWRFLSGVAIEYGSNVPYARLHHAGGISSITITASMLKNLSTWLKKRPEMREDFGYIQNYEPGDSTHFAVKRRPLVGFSADDARAAGKAIKALLAGSAP